MAWPVRLNLDVTPHSSLMPRPLRKNEDFFEVQNFALFCEKLLIGNIRESVVTFLGIFRVIHPPKCAVKVDHTLIFWYFFSFFGLTKKNSFLGPGWVFLRFFFKWVIFLSSIRWREEFKPKTNENPDKNIFK